MRLQWAMFAVAASSMSVSVSAADVDAARRIDATLRTVPISYHVFMSGRDAEQIVQFSTKGCRTSLMTSGGFKDAIDWSRKDAEPDYGTFAQHVGARNANGTLVSFTAFIPGASDTQRSMGTQYAAQFKALYNDASALWTSCSGGR